MVYFTRILFGNGGIDVDELISIIVPVYNVKDYLKTCIDSIVSQTYTNLEIILVDDGSTDGSGEILDAYKKNDERIIVIHKTNGGLSDARNFGIDRHTGEYLFFVDSDDYIHIDTIRLMYNVLKRTDSDIVECGIAHVYDKSNCHIFEKPLSHNYKVYDHDEAVERVINYKSKIMAWNKLYKSSLFKEIRYPVGKINEDVYTTPYVIDKCDKYTYLDAVLYAYVQRDNSIMNRKFNKKRLDIIGAHEKEIQYFNDKYNKKYDIEMKYSYFISLVNLKTIMGNEYKGSIVNSKLNELYKQLNSSNSTLKTRVKAFLYFYFSKSMIRRLEKR